MIVPLLDRTVYEAKIITTKPRPAKKSPIANLAGLDSSRPRFAIPTQSAAKNGARIKIKRELTDWNHVVGISNPRTFRSVKSRANRLSEVGACSNADQNMAANTKQITIKLTGFFP